MLSKRKALIGYGVYTAGKPLAKRAIRKKAKEVPQRKPRRIAATAATAAAAAGAATGGLLYWRRRRRQGAEASEGGESPES
jgi:hypothetical protein